jgi:phenylpyruvate tautomerase PptA (4-oxalocrotonate tautomerase family)
MPLVTATVGAPGARELTDHIVAALTHWTVEALGKERERTSVALQYIAPGQWARGGVPAGGFLVEARVTRGTNTRSEMAAFVREANRSLEQILGAPGYVVVTEIDEAAWGYAGETQQTRYAREPA